MWRYPSWAPPWLIALVGAVLIGYIGIRLASGKPLNRQSQRPLYRRTKRVTRTYDPRNPDDCMEYSQKYGAPLRAKTKKKELR